LEQGIKREDEGIHKTTLNSVRRNEKENKILGIDLREVVT